MWAILEQLRDHATTIVGLVTALTLMYSWFRKPMKQLIAREQQQEEDLAILTWAFLQNAHDNYTRQGWCTAAEKEQVLNMHKVTRRKDEITCPQATNRTFLLCRKRRQKEDEANDEAESIRPVQQTNCSFGHYCSDGDFAAGDGAVLFPQRHRSAGQHGSDIYQLRDDCFRSVQRQLGVREVADAGEEQ